MEGVSAVAKPLHKMLSEADIFSSVFGSNSAFHTTPTPQATPLLGDTGYGQSFGGVATPAKQSLQPTAAQSQIRKNLAWSTATRYLSLDGLKYEAIVQEQKHSLRPKRASREVEEALEVLLAECSSAEDDGQWDLVEWYTLEVRSHFLGVVAQPLLEDWSQV